MQLKTILNQVAKYQSFVYESVKLIQNGEQKELHISIRPRRNSRPICSGCGRPGPGYDTMRTRSFQFIPFWGLLVYFVYAMRRVNCPICGITVEQVPWAQGKSPITKEYSWFLARWAKRISWSEVAQAFRTSWHSVFRAVEMAVTWGRKHMDLDCITAIGVDDMQWGLLHRYITVVYQINACVKRLLCVG